MLVRRIASGEESCGGFVALEMGEQEVENQADAAQLLDMGRPNPRELRFGEAVGRLDQAVVLELQTLGEHR